MMWQVFWQWLTALFGFNRTGGYDGGSKALVYASAVSISPFELLNGAVNLL